MRPCNAHRPPFSGHSCSESARHCHNTPEGKILVAAFMDSYNQLVRATREYKAQEVAGGPGTGGTLAVQGAAVAPAAGSAGTPANVPAKPSARGGKKK
jgi:hypothetical protein